MEQLQKLKEIIKNSNNQTTKMPHHTHYDEALPLAI